MVNPASPRLWSPPQAPKCPKCGSTDWAGAYVYQTQRNWVVSGTDRVQVGLDDEDHGFWNNVACDGCGFAPSGKLLERAEAALRG